METHQVEKQPLTLNIEWRIGVSATFHQIAVQDLVCGRGYSNSQAWG